jgi:hypothetical protein
MHIYTDMYTVYHISYTAAHVCVCVIDLYIYLFCLFTYHALL